MVYAFAKLAGYVRWDPGTYEGDLKGALVGASVGVTISGLIISIDNFYQKMTGNSYSFEFQIGESISLKIFGAAVAGFVIGLSKDDARKFALNSLLKATLLVCILELWLTTNLILYMIMT